VPPRLYPHAAIVDSRRAHAMAHLQGSAHHLGRFQIDDQRGNRLLDLRAEYGFFVDIVVPAGEPVLVSNDAGEVTIVAGTDHPTNLEELVPKKARSRPRGAVAESMRRGLFAAEFGPSYYQGFVDSAPAQMVPVESSPLGVRIAGHPPSGSGRHYAAWSAFGVGAGLLVTSGIFAIMAAQAHADFDSSKYERQSVNARDRYQRYGGVALGTAAASIVSGALGWWLWSRDSHAGQP